jgi:glutaminyl-tRNA synthetase
MRDDLNKNAPRTMVVLRPLKVVITNLDEATVEELEAKIWPETKEGDRSLESYKIPFSRVLYIEQSDFRLKDSKDYYGLAPNKSVMLRYAYPIKCTNVIFKEDKETILEVHAEYDRLKSTKPKVIHWVAEPAPGVDPLKVEVRNFDKLFKSENPAELEEWLGDINSDSKEVITGAMAVPPLRHAAVGSTFQFERLGYYCVDRDTTPETVVFNRTVTLRDSYPKGSGK